MKKEFNFMGVITKGLGTLLIFSIVLLYSFAIMEPTKVIAVTDEIVVSQAVTSGLTITSPADITMTALSLTQDSAVGDTTWTVVTNNQSGYTLTIKASASPALVDSGTGESFADYTSTGKETWSVSNAYEFGWSAYGDNVTGHGTDTDCIEGADVPSAGLLWEGFDGTTPIQMASSTTETGSTGKDTTICVATEQNGVFAPSGTYVATLTATAVTQ